MFDAAFDRVFDRALDTAFDRALDTAIASDILVGKLMARGIGLMLLFVVAMAVAVAMAMSIAGAFNAGALPGASASMADLLPQNIMRRSSL